MYLHLGKERVAVWTEGGATAEEIEREAWQHWADALTKDYEEEK